MKAFAELLHPLLSALDEINNWSDKKTTIKSQLLLSAIERCDFLLSLLVTDYIFSITVPLSLYMQTKNPHLSVTVKFVLSVKKSLEEIRIKGENNSPIFKEVTEKYQYLGVSVSWSRVRVRRAMRNNVQSERNEESFRRFIPFFDSTIKDLSLTETFTVIDHFQVR